MHLRTGTTCQLSASNCIDIEGGYTFWNAIPIDGCKFHQYGVLYEGYANKMIDYNYNDQQIVYSLSTNDITFALTSKSKESLCGYVITRTEHPRLVIFETIKGETFADRTKISVTNLDIFAYVNSKFVYVEKHLKTQIKQLYRDVVVQRCNLERETLKNALAIATQAPDEYAYHLMKGPGYMAVVAGEVVHVIKCIPVEVKVQHGENCYAELEVSKNNKTMFLSPRTHILKNKGTQIACNALLPAFYFLGESWYKILPRPTEAIAPTIIKPMSKPTWTYVSPSSLATTGIYTQNDLNELRERIMFPVERPALLNDIAREMHGHPIADNEGSIMKLLNENAVEKLVSSTWDRMWNKFMTFGTASAGIIAILLIFQIVKSVIDIGIQGYTLHSAYGWSIYLLGALWSTLTYFLLHSRKEQQKTHQEDESTIEVPNPPLTSVVVHSSSPQEEVTLKKGSAFLQLSPQ